jgi:biopolymer transport protein TolQ
MFALDFQKIVLETTFAAQVIIFGLSIISITSWTIIGAKSVIYFLTTKNTRRFISIFEKKLPINQIKDEAVATVYSPLSRIYLEVFNFLPTTETNVKKLKDVGDLKMLENKLTTLISKERERLESNITFLAIASSVSPFLGLYGTVWGLMDSFQQIGIMGTASIAVVGPGVSEALSVTAVGLIAAIPAAIFYNIAVKKINNYVEEMLNFSDLLLMKLTSEKVL